MQSLHATSVRYCPLCDKKILQKQMFAENDLIVCLVDTKPMRPGHILIIPKRHVTYYHELTHAEQTAINKEITRIHKALQRTNGPLHYTLINKNGYLGGQSIPHVHIHFIPAFLNEKNIDDSYQPSGLKNIIHTLNLYCRFCISSLFPRLSEKKLASKVQEMKHAMSKLDSDFL